MDTSYNSLIFTNWKKYSLASLEVTLSASIDLYSHWYVNIPSQWPKTDMAFSDWWIKVVMNYSIIIIVSLKFLIRERYIVVTIRYAIK